MDSNTNACRNLNIIPKQLDFPVYIEIGGSRVLLHVILEVLAFFIGFRYFLRLRAKEGDSISSPNRTLILIGAIFGAFIGSRLIGGLENPAELARTNNVWLHFFQNKTVLGGFLGGLMGVELMKKFIREKQASGDLFVFPIILALIIGRIGCFTMGIYEETYGTVTMLPLGMDLGDGYFRHPVCLYEIVFLILLWILLAYTNQKLRLQRGALFKLFMIAYLIFRFLLDFIKPHYSFNIGLSVIQLTCIAGLLWYSRYILQPKKLIVTTYA
jgi:phosphatidylglycerol:prolipoprotein diacylglycerol transferase